jgi:hypothetical protein
VMKNGSSLTIYYYRFFNPNHFCDYIYKNLLTVYL